VCRESFQYLLLSACKFLENSIPDFEVINVQLKHASMNIGLAFSLYFNNILHILLVLVNLLSLNLSNHALNALDSFLSNGEVSLFTFFNG